ncbi:type II secretion system F family protein [Rhodococcus sp. NPDC127528]|uniref:type II secretion system F family protein n=1 Tax=unclassified Rhodococcus (in: high G+C Gram-positive bacteria) TaxID=192944 RepID=UPI00362764C0
MIPALLLGALALVVAPAGDPSRRLRPAQAGSVRAARVWGPRAIGVGVVAAAALAGPAAALAAATLACTVAHRVRRRRLGRDRVAEQRGLLAALEAAVGELRVGTHPAAACATAAEEAKGTAAEAFRGAAATARLGGSAAAGLRAPGGAIDADLDRIAAAWKVAEQHGIALAELLDAARTDLLGRIRFRDRVESGLAGARATAAVLAGLPLLGIALGQLMGAGPLRVLLSGGLGGVLLVLGTVLVCAGLLWTDRITGRVAG